MSTLGGASPELRIQWANEWSTPLEAPLPPAPLPPTAGIPPGTGDVVSNLSTSLTTSESSAHYSTVADAGGVTIPFLSSGQGVNATAMATCSTTTNNNATAAVGRRDESSAREVGAVTGTGADDKSAPSDELAAHNGWLSSSSSSSC